jgi:hypothetical protein
MTKPSPSTEMATYTHDKGEASEKDEEAQSNQKVSLSLYEYTHMLQSIHGQQPRGLPPPSGILMIFG